MNKDQVAGKAEQVTGRIKQGVGEVLGNQELANEGVVDQVKGAAKETWGNVKDAAAVIADRHQKEAEARANETRAGIRARVEDANETVNSTIDEQKLHEREKARTA